MFEELRDAYNEGVHEFWGWTQDKNATLHDAHEAGLRAAAVLAERLVASKASPPLPAPASCPGGTDE